MDQNILTSNFSFIKKQTKDISIRKGVTMYEAVERKKKPHYHIYFENELSD